MLDTFARIRDGRPDDGEALARVHRESWELAYRGIIPEPALRCMIDQRSPDWWRRAAVGGDPPVVLEAGGEVAGYATMGASRLAGMHQGEIYELYLGPIYQGLGLGELLFEAARHRLDQRSYRGLMVWALADNTAACDFYARRGGKPFVRGYQTLGGKCLEKIAFGWA